MRTKFLLLFLFIGLNSFGESYPDSLKHELSKYELKNESGSISNDTNRINLLNKLAGATIDNDQEQSFQYAQSAFEKASVMKMDPSLSLDGKGNGYYEGIKLSLVWIETYYNNKSQFEKALALNDERIKIGSRKNDSLYLAQTLLNRAVIYRYQNDNFNALEYGNRGYKIAESIRDTSLMSLSYQTLAGIYGSMKDYAKELHFYKYAANGYVSSRKTRFLPSVLLSIGASYSNLGKPDSAILYFDSAMHVSSAQNNLNIEALSATRMGIIYLEKKDFEKAKKFIEYGYVISKKVGNTFTSGRAAIRFAEYYVAMAVDKNSRAILSEADKYFDEGFMLLKQSADIPTLMQYYKIKNISDSLTGNYKSAYFNYLRFDALEDSLNRLRRNEEVRASLSEINFQREEAKNRLEQEKIKYQYQSKIDRQRYGIYAAIVVVVFITILTLFLLKRNKERKLANLSLKHSNDQLEKAMQELRATQEQLIESEKMAVFGTMASRMAHEILNPLNFVSNFSEINNDLVNDFISASTEEERKQLAEDLKTNLEKTIFHSKRAQEIIQTLQKSVNEGTAHTFFEEVKE